MEGEGAGGDGDGDDMCILCVAWLLVLHGDVIGRTLQRGVLAVTSDGPNSLFASASSNRSFPSLIPQSLHV
jgi:hypothetical protein